MEADSLIGGMVSSAVSGSHPNHRDLRVVQQELGAHPEWRALLGARFDLMHEAADALARFLR